MKNLYEKSDTFIANTYARYPYIVSKGFGINVYDDKNNEYIDCFSGISVCNLGHCHPDVVNAVKEQAEKLFHISNLYYTKSQTELAEKLVKSSFADRVFFANSGAEANEAAIKLARKYGFDTYGSNRNRIITFSKSFHGRTLATIAATGQDKVKKGFYPIPDGFDEVPFGDLDALKNAITEKTCAIMMEPVQGEGGINIPDKDYVLEIRRICDEKNILLIFDEIQTGMARTGKMFAYEHFNVEPDIMTLAKALGNGLPIGAMLAKNFIMESFGPGSHGSTFGGNPISCAAANVVMDIINRDSIVSKTEENGKYFLDLLNQLKEKYKFIKDVRGLGLLIGIELDIEDKNLNLVDLFAAEGFFINLIQGNIIRMAPPLIIEKDIIDRIIEAMDNIFENF